MIDLASLAEEPVSSAAAAHASMRALIQQLLGMASEEPQHVAHVTVLSE